MKINAYLVLSVKELRELARVAAREGKLARKNDRPEIHTVILSGEITNRGQAPDNWQLSSHDVMKNFRQKRV